MPKPNGGTSVPLKVFISFFNEIDLLPGLVASVREHIDGSEIIGIDGKFKDFPMQGSRYQSNDGSDDFFKEENLRVYGVGLCRNEAAKRNFIFEKVEEGEKFLYLDADEEVMKFNKDLVEEGLCRLYLRDDDIFLSKRVHTYEDGMRFVTHSHIIKDNWVVGNMDFKDDIKDKEVALEVRVTREEPRPEMVEYKKRQHIEEVLTMKALRAKGLRCL